MSEDYRFHLDRAHEFYDDGNYEAARAAAQYALESDPPADISEAQTVIALALRKLEYNDKAFKMLSEIVVKTPNPDACAEYALMSAERGICDEVCRENAEMAIEQSPDNASAYVALFWYHQSHENYVEALRHLKRGMHRGAEFSAHRAFELVRSWCQDACNREDPASALEISGEIADYFNNLDFSVLHARIAEIASEPRIAVQYYKKALGWLRPGPMRTDILEAIARLAI